jgi:hypothetical protein
MSTNFLVSTWHERENLNLVFFDELYKRISGAEYLYRKYILCVPFSVLVMKSSPFEKVIWN